MSETNHTQSADSKPSISRDAFFAGFAVVVLIITSVIMAMELFAENDRDINKAAKTLLESRETGQMSVDFRIGSSVPVDLRMASEGHKGTMSIGFTDAGVCTKSIVGLSVAQKTAKVAMVSSPSYSVMPPSKMGYELIGTAKRVCEIAVASGQPIKVTFKWAEDEKTTSI